MSFHDDISRHFDELFLPNSCSLHNDHIEKSTLGSLQLPLFSTRKPVENTELFLDTQSRTTTGVYPSAAKLQADELFFKYILERRCNMKALVSSRSKTQTSSANICTTNESTMAVSHRREFTSLTSHSDVQPFKNRTQTSLIQVLSSSSLKADASMYQDELDSQSTLDVAPALRLQRINYLTPINIDTTPLIMESLEMLFSQHELRENLAALLSRE